MEPGKDKYRLLMEHLPDAFAYHQIITDSSGKPVDYIFLEVNPAFEQMTGFSREQVIGKKATELHPGIENSSIGWIDTFGKVALTGESISFEQYFDISERWYAVTAYSDEPGYFAVYFRDITSSIKEKIDQELLLDNIETQIWYLKDEKTYGSVNQAKADFFGVQKEELENKSLYDLMSTREEAETCIAGNLEVFRQKQKLHSEELVFNGSGEPRLLSITKAPKLDSNNNVEYVVCSAEDITERKETEESLRASEEKYRNLIENLNEVAYILDDQTRVSYVSPNIEALAGYDSSEVLGRPFTDFVHPDDLEGRIQQFQKIIAGINEPTEYRMLTKEGRAVWVRTAARLVTRDGSLAGIQGVLTDITSLKQAEESLRYQLELEKLVSEISSYLGSLSAEQLNEGISTALKMAGEYFKVDRSYVFQFSSDGLTRSLTHEWCAAGVKPQKERLQDQPLTNLPWWTEKLKSKSCIHIPEADSLPPEAEGERREFKAQNLNSLIYVPITKAGQLIGALGFNSVKQKMEWTKAHENHLFMLAELLSSALARYQAEKALKASEEKYREILSTIEEGYYEVDLAGNFVFFNDSFCKVLGYSRDELMQRSYKMLYKSPQEVFQTYNRVYRTGEAEKAADWPVTTKDGRELFIEVSITLRRDEAGNPIGFRGIARDVTERRLVEEKLREHEKLQQLLMKMATDLINVSLEKVDAAINEMLEAVGNSTKVDRVYIFKHDYNRRVTSNTYEWCAEGIAPEIDNLQATPFNYFPGILEAHQKGEVVHIPDVAKMPEDHAMRSIFEAQGIQSLIWLPLFCEGVNTGFVGFDAVKQKKVFTEQEINLLKVLAEITSNVLARQKTETKIRYMSFHDSLTGLYNRYYLEEEMHRLDTSRQLPISIIMVDLNGLKLVNDTYGHETGDEMLKSAAGIIKNSCRREDIVGRWGGDEFVVLLPQTPVEEVEKIHRRIKDKCRDVNVKGVPVSLAVGSGTKESTEKSLEAVLKEAEDSMYKQKLAEQKSARSSVLNTLLKTLQAKSYETEEHTMRMVNMAWKIGEKIGLADTELNRLNLVITLHDIGKINIPETTLTKEGSPTDEEWEIIKTHPEIGYRITRASEEFAHVSEDILAHHERWDGQGYPQGLKEKEIPLLARITAIVDVYDVMSYGRPYKKPMSQEEIITEIRRCAGTQFDPELVGIFLSVLEE